MLTKTNIKLGLVFGITLIAAVLTPHIVYGHVLISEKYAQSIILLLDLTVAFMFYFIYRKEVNDINEEKREVEESLIASYKYIGRTNVQIDLYDKFINFFSGKGIKNKSEEKKVFGDLLKIMINSVTKADKGLIRFVEVKAGRTVKEFSYHKDGDQFIARIPNKDIIASRQSRFVENNKFYLMQSDYIDVRIICIFCFAKKNKEKFDKQLLKTLVNQIHLLFLVNFSGR